MAAQVEKQEVITSPHQNEPVHTYTGVKAKVKDPEQGDPISTNDNAPERGKIAWLIITIAFMSGTFLVALDTNILATAIPKITTEFNSLDHVSWYGAAYSLCKMVFQPSFGRLCSLFPLKTVFYVANGLLILGSIICALAPSSEVLILGRAIQGWGGAGIFSTQMTMTVLIISKQKAALFISLLSSMYIVASVLGPVIGGVFAGSYLTWRFCFWINLPLAAVSLILTFFFIPEPKRELIKKPMREKLMKLDPLGTCILMASVSSLILALQWGGVTLPWDHAQVWGCILCFALTMIIFIIYQIRQKEDALIPIRIVTQRTVAASCVFVCCLIMSVNSAVYFLPFYFQTSLGLSSTKSGLYILPLAALNPIAAIISAAAVTKTGVYVPWMLASGAIATVGYGLISMLSIESSLATILGYQIVASVGFGFGVQMPFTATRNVLDDMDVPVANALIVFFQGLGTSLSLSIGQTIFLNTLKHYLRNELPTSELNALSDFGTADTNDTHVSSESRPIVAEGYAKSMRTTMYFAIAAAIIAFLAACMVEWKKIERSESRTTKDEESPDLAATEEVLERQR